MTRYRIRETEGAVSIELTEVEGQQEELLSAFQECQSGHCSCPTDQYEKVAAMDVEATDRDIALRLVPKPGERFDVSEIATCLDHTVSKANPDEAPGATP